MFFHERDVIRFQKSEHLTLCRQRIAINTASKHKHKRPCLGNFDWTPLLESGDRLERLKKAVSLTCIVPACHGAIK